jgi:Xaa-Pro aminopeptidase
MFDKKFFVQNRKKLVKASSSSLIVVSAHALLQESADATYPFRQDSNFWYLTGIDFADWILVIDIARGSEFLIAPKLSEYQGVFDEGLSPMNAKKISGIDDVLDNVSGRKRLRKLILQSEVVGLCVKSGVVSDTYGMYYNPSRAMLEKYVLSISKTIVVDDIRSLLARQRIVKQPQEIAQIEHAIEVTIKAFEQARSLIGTQSVLYEYQIESEIEHIIRKSGLRTAYKSIVATANNACTLHYNSNLARVDNGSSVLIDAGARSGYYAADITRNYCYGTPSIRQQEVHNALKVAQENIISLLRPGLLLKDYQKFVDEIMAKAFRSLGLDEGSDVELVRKYMPHAVSHFLGLDVHDVGDYSSPLASGVVMTVEPGIYMPDEGIGFRIEDDILITETGNINLSKKLGYEL